MQRIPRAPLLFADTTPRAGHVLEALQTCSIEKAAHASCGTFLDSFFFKTVLAQHVVRIARKTNTSVKTAVQDPTRAANISWDNFSRPGLQTISRAQHDALMFHKTRPAAGDNVLDVSELDPFFVCADCQCCLPQVLLPVGRCSAQE
jgi:hypothetical protein